MKKKEVMGAGIEPMTSWSWGHRANQSTSAINTTAITSKKATSGEGFALKALRTSFELKSQLAFLQISFDDRNKNHPSVWYFLSQIDVKLILVEFFSRNVGSFFGVATWSNIVVSFSKFSLNWTSPKCFHWCCFDFEQFNSDHSGCFFLFV